MDDQSVRGARAPAPGRASRAASDQPGVIGIALAAVLTAMLAQGSWQWFATYVGVTLLAIIFCFSRLPRWTPGRRAAHVGDLSVYALVVGLCVAITLAPMLQRWAWLFPMPGTRAECGALGAYESLRTRAALADLADRGPAALAHAQEVRSHAAVADCLSATTTLWLPVYAAGAALLVGVVAAFSAVRGRRPARGRRGR
ncbi:MULTISPECIES: hypothetical protein [unclassified Streptomyces]|uniref:hypothetical protein n=1 Tax=unclassified Streptomyces TaxID=2593676 RepID=UPI00074983A6|nr:MULTISPECIES: hypothetical protein [unclassified Streptomyces]KUL49477.1 hypothetical protein ADL30_32935 [Streptomyces sp. NRRL S-1521]